MTVDPLSMSWDDVMAPHLNAELRGRLARACVGLVGAGGLGSNCAALLARSGVGRLVVADFDTVSPSNLNRQHFFPEHVGRLKVDALADMLHRINPCVRVDTRAVRLDAETVVQTFTACDVVVEAVDRADVKKMLLETFIKAGTFIVGASGMAGWGGPCMAIRRLADKAVVVGDGLHGVSESMPVLAPRVMMAAAMQADQVLAYLLGDCPGLSAHSPVPADDAGQ